MDCIAEINDFVNWNDHVIQISKQEWARLKASYSKSELIDTLLQVCMSMPVPFATVTAAEAREHFLRLAHVSSDRHIVDGPWRPTKGFPYAFPLSDRYVNCGGSSTNKASNYFHQHRRWEIDSKNGLGPVGQWCSYKEMYSHMARVYKSEPEIIDRSLKESLLRREGYIAAQFKPAAAKAIYDDLTWSKNEVILDFCAGWGDRLCGFFASRHGREFYGIDPAKENQKNYEQQISFYQQCLTAGEKLGFPRKSAYVMCARAQHADLRFLEGKVDLAFTSPPYFNTEEYSSDPSQSTVEFQSLDNWLQGFLYPSIDNVWRTLRPGGLLMINMADVETRPDRKSKKRRCKICDAMNEYIGSMRDSVYLGAIGYRISNQRDNALGPKGPTCEPIWSWQRQ